MGDDMFGFGRLFGVPKKEPAPPAKEVSTQRCIDLQKGINKRENEVDMWSKGLENARKKALECRKRNDESGLNRALDDMTHYQTLIDTSEVARGKLKTTITNHTQVNVLLETQAMVGDGINDMKGRLAKEVDMAKFDEAQDDQDDIADSIKDLNNLMKSGTKKASGAKDRNKLLALLDEEIDASDKEMEFLKKEPPVISRSGDSVFLTTATISTNTASAVPKVQNNSHLRSNNAKTGLFTDF